MQDKYGDIIFTYSAAWLNDAEAKSISCSLPLQVNAFDRKKCSAFFNGILPEAHQRKLIAKILGISAQNDYAMLAHIGGECAGALTFVPSENEINLNDSQYIELQPHKLASVLRELPTRPLLAGMRDIRLSLAGVQDKLAVYIRDGKTYIPLNYAPSTHILKPNFSLYEGIISNEALCMTLAKKIGLPVAEVAVKKIEDIEYLSIKRYDRIQTQKVQGDFYIVQRLHQEDFCQALNIISRNKYQNEGGPTLKQCFNLIRSFCYRPIIDINNLLDVIIFNYFIGNCDAHGKNFSLLHDEHIHLAPFYDLVSTTYYKNLSHKMAMKIGGEYNIDKISISNFEKLADEAGLSKPAVRRRIAEMIEKSLQALNAIDLQTPTQTEIAEIIKQRCNQFSFSMRTYY